MDDDAAPGHRGNVDVHPIRTRRERRARELHELEVFRTVRRVAEEDVRALLAVARDRATVASARAALDAATTADDVVALEPLVIAGWSELGLSMAHDRAVRIGSRWVPWERLGCYRAVAEAARAAEPQSVPEKRFIGVLRARWADDSRGESFI